MRKVTWLLLLSCATGCGMKTAAPDGPATDPTTPTAPAPVRTDHPRVSESAPASIDDGAIQIEMRRVHGVYLRADGTQADKGVPYLKLGDGWLEIAAQTTVVVHGRTYRLTLGACSTTTVSREDYGYQTIDACDVTVDLLSAAPASLAPFASTTQLSLGDRYLAGAHAPAGGGFVSVRSTGFEIGNVDMTTKPWTTLSLNAGLDVVTPFGVKNIDIAYTTTPILGHEETFTLGPQIVTLKILAAGNTNTLCDPTCRNVFDVEVTTELAPNAPPSADVAVVSY